ncbi:MAG: Ig-like domain-containing protein, partial [Cyclobacteriaceae bacterium]|nr:Ig-like domain-containing protein [Cyclobacteriaceae bacterium]
TVDPSTFIFSTPNAGSFSAQWNSDTFSFEDVAVPVIASLNPVNGALAVPINANLQITFTEAVKKTTSTTPKVKIYQNGVGSPIATYTAKSAPELTLSGGDLVLTINPANFLPGTEYYLKIDDGAFLDLQDNNFAGIDNSTVVWAFKTYAPPVITSYNPESCINNTITIIGQNFAGYPGDVIGVTKVEFAKSGGGVTNGTLTFVSDTEIQVGIPSNAVTGPISVYKGTDVSNSTALAIPDINLDFTIGITNGDLSVCSLESNLIYSVDTDLVDYSDLSYNWTLSSNILPVIKADVNAILVNVGTGSGASTISVNKTRVSDGCVSNTYNFNITVHPKPTVIFDPITSHSNLNQNGYTLVLKNGSSTPIANGKEPLFPFVTFSGNGVTKELNSPDDIFKFNSYNLPVADHTVSYYYMDGNQCEVTGNQIFNVYDGTSTIGGLNPDYCNYDIAPHALTPLMEPGSALYSMEVLDVNGVVHTSGSGWGLNGVAPNYTFTPSEAATHMGTNKFITLNFRYTYITPALAVITKENIYSTVFDRPDADFELTVGDNNIFRVDKLLNLQLCENSIPITLTPISKVVAGISTVNFTSDNSGNPITGDVFDPSAVSFSDINRVLPEQVNVTFTYTEDMGSGTATCSNTKVLPIKVYPQPAVPTIQEFNGVAFSMDPQAPTDPLICVTSVVPTAQIIDKHTNDALTTVAWFTNEEGTGNPASIQDTYKADINTLSEGDGNYRYLFQTYDKFCRSERLRMNYEYFPNLNFTTSSNVLTADPVLTSEFGSIVPSAYAWDVVSLTDDTPITVPTVQNPTLSGLANDIYQVSLTIQSTNGCSASLPKNMMFFTPIQPNVPGGIMGDATYQFNFGDSNYDWFSVTDYQKGDTYKKLSGGNLWVHTNNLMGNTQYNTNTPDTAIYWSTVIDINNELPTDTAGFLVSPSFDLSNYLRPMVSFNAHYTLDDEDDGVVLQYTNETLIDEDTQWKTIGSVQSGVNWFNLSGISTTPGNQVVNIYGWSNIRSKEMNNTKGGWLESKHQLGSISITDFSNVIFRFSLATDNKAETRPNGFAISDFFIGNRTRTVLVENFANSGGGTDVNNENTLLYAFANNVNNEIQDNNTDILLLNYRTPFPDTFDELYKKNPADHGVRVDFYNINDIPRSRIDGYEGKPNLPWSAWGEREYNVRSLELAQMNIDISTTVNFNGLQAKSLSITAALTPRVDIPENAVMIMAVVDKMIDPAYGTTPSSGEVQVQNLVRKILPDGAGHRFPNGIPVSGGTQQITYEYYFEPDIDPANLAIIVFIQDFSENGRKEVYQSEFYNVNPADIGTTITGINDINLREISLYPVPANDFTKLALNKPLYSDSKVRLFDNMGKEVWNGSMNSGTNTLDLNTSRFASGVYIIQIESDSELIGHERLIIKH